MTYEEAMKVLAILKGAYPNSYRGVTTEEAKLTATVWASQFASIPAKVVMISVNKLISTNTFPPSINEVKEGIRGLYWEVWEMLDFHERGFNVLPEKTVAQLEEIMAIVEPMRTREKLEPTLGELLEGFGGYLSGGSRDDTKQLQ